MAMVRTAFSSSCSLGFRSRRLAGGGQVGYNWQFGQFVLGAEADLQGSGANDMFAAYNFPTRGSARCAAAPVTR